MEKDAGRKITTLRVDGGACASDLLMQTQADLLGLSVERPKNIESTAIGAIMLAGLGAGVWADFDTLTAIRSVDRTFTASITNKDRTARMKIWKKAVKRAQNWSSPL